jgi:regulator of sigma E protease
MTALSILHSSYIAVIFFVLPYIVALIAIVFIHEFGHFYVGRLCGVSVETFSVGFGKEIFGFFDRHGTRWKFCWIPLGGYVRFLGDANAASMPSVDAVHTPGSLQAASLWKRMAIVLAGPAANFILAIAIFTLAFTWIGTQVAEPRVDGVTDDGAAKVAGLQSGDFIRKIDGQQVKSFFDIQEAMILRGEKPVALEVERGGQMININLTPRIKEVDDGFGSTTRTSLIGFTHDFAKDPKEPERLSLTQAFNKSVGRTIFFSETTLRYIGKIIMGSERSNQLHGPIGVAKIAGDVAALGIWPFITFIGMISVSIGLVNLFPIPMLDGGHLVFYLIEGLVGKPVSPQAQEWSFRIGLSVILMLMIFVSINDIGRFAAMGFGT